jgi:hypothetical protein
VVQICKMHLTTSLHIYMFNIGTLSTPASKPPQARPAADSCKASHIGLGYMPLIMKPNCTNLYH